MTLPDELPDEPFCFVGPPHYPEWRPTMKPTTLNIVLGILGVVLVMCVGGIIALSLQEPARSIPDILVGTTTLIVGGILGLLAPSRPTS